MPTTTALVTGAGSGIGRAVARRLSASGMFVACLDLDLESAESTVHDLVAGGGAAIAVSADVADTESVDAALDIVSRHDDGLDIVVNAAGIAFREGFVETDLGHLDQMWAVNLRGTYAVCRACVPALSKRGGAIVNVASVAGLRGSYGLAAYSATKGAVAALSAALAVELSPLSIRVNCVSPGAVDTPLLHRLSAPAHAPGDLADRSRSLSGRAATPDEVADAIVFLAAPTSLHLTGVNLPIDGGSTA